MEIIFEGELMKYKPGIKHQYMSRWSQVTKTHFLYYAEGVPYASYLGRPLAVIPLSQIQSVRRVCVEVPEKSEKYSVLKNYQFEIFLKKANPEGGEPVLGYGSKVEPFDGSAETYTSPLLEQEILNSAKKIRDIVINEDREGEEVAAQPF